MKTWARKWCAKSPARPATPPAMARRPRPFWPTAIYREGLKFVTAGASPISIQRGINKAVEAATEHLTKISKKVKDKEEIKQVATVSSNWDTTIGEIIADAMDKVGKDGTITVEEAKSIETTLEVVEGMQFDKG